MRILVVGGTADGRKLATELHRLGFDVIYSIAGIVRKATVPCESISGGFSQFGGLAKYVTEHVITHVIDATHPFAQTMSNTIAQVSIELSIISIRFHRQQWQKTDQDNWVEVSDWPTLIEKVAQHRCLFVTAGQVSQAVIDALSAQTEQVLLRTAMPAKIILAANVTWLKAIGPFHLEDEKQLLQTYNIDAVISKNSGGDATYAKIIAARSASIPVYQFKRPDLQPLQYQFDNAASCIALLKESLLSTGSDNTHRDTLNKTLNKTFNNIVIEPNNEI
ncbi:precorrin-6A/cobalt-precorrin-6A reductase [uncultured Psychromonas sp.]|uniref:precorrin-6A/cobalt-precorrin-6A reductase n=1 Tax=uncultured Psychromonas sp. TaxID=173974 RepID=UPI002630F0C5|nr:precorrin-6A/cobalt-precorrin-6A reductase [uncultured Psychromonas sp.]